MTSSDFLSITPWVSVLKANCPHWHEKRECFLAWVFALALTACGYWENFSNEVPGLGGVWGVGESGSGAVDVPGLGREVLGESQPLQAASEVRQLLALGWHCTVSLARNISLPGFSRDARGMTFSCTDRFGDTFNSPSCPWHYMFQLQALCVYAVLIAVLGADSWARAMAGKVNFRDVILMESRICYPKVYLFGISLF